MRRLKVMSRLHHALLQAIMTPRLGPWYGWPLMVMLMVLTGVTLIADRLVALGYVWPESLAMMFVIPVFCATLWYEIRLVLLTIILSILIYDWLLLPPIGDISLWEGENAAKLLVLMLVAGLGSALVGVIRQVAEEQEHKRRDETRERFLSALLSSVSHDIKTPLVTIIGSLSSLAEIEPKSTHKTQHAIAMVGLEEAQKLNRFLGNLLEISRLESGLFSIQRQTILLHDAIASALKTLQPLWKNQPLSIDIADDVPLLEVNGALFELVLLNVIENSIKYGPETGEIHIIARCEQNNVIITISDQGPGISTNEQDAVFMKFYRTHQGDHKIAGTGLGLYICRTIMDAHGGIIRAVSPVQNHMGFIEIIIPQTYPPIAK